VTGWGRGRLDLRREIRVAGWEGVEMINFIGPPIGPAKIVSCFGLALWAEVAAQALKGSRAGPALSTIDRASDRARAVLFRVVLRASNRVRLIWNTTLGSPVVVLQKERVHGKALVAAPPLAIPSIPDLNCAATALQDALGEIPISLAFHFAASHRFLCTVGRSEVFR
jgi:hypothetical protein